MDSSFDDENDDSGDYARLVSTRDEDLLRDWKIGVVSQAALNNMLEEDERVVEARPRSWWYAHRMFFGISLLGTIVFLGLLIWQLASRTMSKYFYYFLMMAMFPILFLGAVLQAMRARKHETWVAVTTKRVLLFSDVDTVLAVKLANILSWRPWINWLMWSREIELKTRPEQVFNVTTISRQSPFKLEYLDGLVPDDRVAIEAVLQERVGLAGAALDVAPSNIANNTSAQI